MFVHEAGPADGIPAVMIHGNLATGRFYEQTGGSVTSVMFEGSGHRPHFDAADRWMETFFGFLAQQG